MNVKNLSVLVATVGVVVLASVAVFRTPPTPQVIVNVPETQATEQTYGSGGWDFPSPYIRFGDRWIENRRVEMVTSTTVSSTTPCAILSPTATSTFQTAFYLSTATSSAISVQLSTSTSNTRYATSTAIVGTPVSFAANVGGVVISAPENSTQWVPGSTWLVWSVYGSGTGGGYAGGGAGAKIDGTCTATFFQL